MKHLLGVAQQFSSQRLLEIREYGRGNVHDTFLVTPEAPAESRFILQRLNTRVFQRPDLVMHNLKTCTEHVARRLQSVPLSPGRRWEVPRVLPTWDGRDYFIDPEGSFWRALSFIEGAETFDVITDTRQAGEVGYALGRFHNLLSDLPAASLADTLPGFHVTPGYLTHYDEVLAVCSGEGRGTCRSPTLPPNSSFQKSPEVNYALRWVAARRAWAGVLEEARAQGRLPLRPMHGDPKVNNVLMDTTTGQAVALVDLDTVKPGLVQYDIGDCLRSGCNPLGEETERWEAVHFDPELCRAILTGYLSEARDFLTGDDYDYLYDAVRLLAFELGLRFFTDYLEGNVYFKARHREHNLARALVQLKLTESIESQAAALGAIIRELR